MREEFSFGRRVDEVGLVAQSLGACAAVGKQGKLGQTSRLFGKILFGNAGRAERFQAARVWIIPLATPIFRG